MTDTPATPPVPPVIVTPPLQKTMAETIRGWLDTTSKGGILAAILGALATGSFKPPPLPPPIVQTVDQTKVNDAVNTAIDPANPKLRDVVLKIVQSGVPGEAIQTGASLIPGAGPFATAFEPLFRQWLIERLQQPPQQQPTPTPPRRPAR